MAGDQSIADRPSVTHTLPAGTQLFTPGQQCQGYVVLHKGVVRVSLIAENGREIVLYRVQPGDVCLQTFGCLVSGETYGAQGVTESEVVLEILPAGEFHRRIAADAPFRAKLFAAVARRFADLEQLVEDVALSPLATRLARALLRLADARGTVTATHERIAIEIGSAREVVSRQLGAFARAGMIASARGHIAVLDAASLQRVAHMAGTD